MSVGLGVLFGVFIAAVLIDAPIAIALGLASIAYIFVADAAPLMVAAQRTVAGLDSFTLLAIPLFVLAGGLLTRSGLTERIVRLCSALVGQVRGGLALAMVVACMLFGALSGSGVADVIAIGTLLLPAMEKRGYPVGHSCALLGCAGSLGTVIPPSIVMIVYGVATSTSIGQLFMAGIIPGILSGLALMGVAWFHARRHGWGSTERFTWAELVGALKSSALALVAPILIVGGIRSGAFTATEAGGIGVAYALLVGLLVTRTMGLADVWDELKRAAEISGAILLVIATASLFGWILASERTPQLVGQWMVSITDSRWVVLLLLMTLLLILGTFMETIAIILILAPIFSALFARYGIDPVHFGLLLTLNLAIGANTPPLGIDLMAACRVAGIPMSDTFRYLGPFLLAMIAVMLFVVFVPGVATWLPRATF
jgi:tripartite ATP-independent transporter DctM subunit